MWSIFAGFYVTVDAKFGNSKQLGVLENNLLSKCNNSYNPDRSSSPHCTSVLERRRSHQVAFKSHPFSPWNCSSHQFFHFQEDAVSSFRCFSNDTSLQFMQWLNLTGCTFTNAGNRHIPRIVFAKFCREAECSCCVLFSPEGKWRTNFQTVFLFSKMICSGLHLRPTGLTPSSSRESRHRGRRRQRARW